MGETINAPPEVQAPQHVAHKGSMQLRVGMLQLVGAPSNSTSSQNCSVLPALFWFDATQTKVFSVLSEALLLSFVQFSVSCSSSLWFLIGLVLGGKSSGE